MGVSLHWESKCSSQTEVSELDVAFCVNEEVLRLEISVHHSVSVTVGCALENLISEGLDFLGWEWTTNLSHVLLEVILTILKDEIELIFRVNDFFKPEKCNNSNLTQQYWGA